MIYGNVNAQESQAAYSPLLRRAIDYCRKTDFSQMHESRFHPEGEDFEVLVCERTTGPKAEKKAEVHRRCAELQFCCEGRQSMGFCPDTGNFPVLEDHLDEDRDVRFYTLPEEAHETMLPLYPGQYCLFFPEDVHRPWCMAAGQPEPIKMIVLKIPMADL